MTSVYIDYPTSHFSIGYGIRIADRRQQAHDRREYYLNQSTLGPFLADCRQGKIRFASQAGLNSIWVELDLGGDDQEERAIKDIQEALRHYKRIREAEWRYVE